MLTFEDCVELSELPEDVIEAIAWHEHIPMMIALEMGAKMMSTSWGQKCVRQYIQDDINHCRCTGDNEHTRYFEQVLEHYEKIYPGL